MTKSIASVGDIRLLSRDRIIASPTGCVLLPPNFKKAIKFKALAEAFAIQSIHTFVGARALESEKELIYCEQLHTKRITCLAVGKHGEYAVTGKVISRDIILV